MLKLINTLIIEKKKFNFNHIQSLETDSKLHWAHFQRFSNLKVYLKSNVSILKVLKSLKLIDSIFKVIKLKLNKRFNFKHFQNLEYNLYKILIQNFKSDITLKVFISLNFLKTLKVIKKFKFQHFDLKMIQYWNYPTPSNKVIQYW